MRPAPTRQQTVLTLPAATGVSAGVGPAGGAGDLPAVTNATRRAAAARDLRAIADGVESGSVPEEEIELRAGFVAESYFGPPGQSAATIDGSMVLQEPPPPHYPVLAGLFDQQSLVEVVGPSKTRKSFAVMQLAMSLASGRDVFGFNAGGTFSVCLADLELSEPDIRRRLWRMGMSFGVSPGDVGDRLRILSLAGVQNARPVIEKSAVGFDVLICDPLYSLCDGAETIENFREPLRWLRRLAMQRAACVFVHHDGKGLSGERDTRDRGSGSGITGRAVDARITLTPSAADPDATVVMAFMCRSYLAPEARAYTFVDDAFRASDLPPEPERQADRRRQQRPKLAGFTEAAIKILERGQMPPSVFKEELRGLGLSKNDADTLTASLCTESGPARRWATKAFPAEHFIGLKEQSSQSSQEDCQEDK